MIEIIIQYIQWLELYQEFGKTIYVIYNITTNNNNASNSLLAIVKSAIFMTRKEDLNTYTMIPV